MGAVLGLAAGRLPARWRLLASHGSGVVRAHWGDRHYRNGYYLMLNSAVGALAGLLFWLVLVRVYDFPESDVGVGLAIISLGTALALLAKGGLDAALVRHVPRVPRDQGLRLLGLAMLLGMAALAGLLAVLAALPTALEALGAPAVALSSASLALVAILATALLAAWLLDAHFLAEGEARFSFYRNLVMHGGRLAAPALVVALALPLPIASSWAVGLAASALLAAALLPRVPDHRPAAMPRHGGARKPFLRSTARNLTGSAAEFLPGLMLPPLVLQLEGAERAAYFGMAWTGASMLFLLSAAICRSTFAEMSRHGHHGTLLRRAARHHLLILAPATLLALLLSPWLLGLFGEAYAREGQGVFVVLAASVGLTAPVWLYVALLRSREDRWALVALPAVLVAAVVALAPTLLARFGLVGVGAAWALAHAPLAVLAVRALRREMRRPHGQEVTHGAEPSPAHGGAPHLE